MSSSLSGDAFISVIVGSGFVLTVLLLALVERLRRTFATRQELNDLGDKFNALQSLCFQVRETANEARDRAKAAENEQKNQSERISQQVIRPLERTTHRLEAVCEAQAAQATALSYISKRLDQADACRGASHHDPRRTS